MRLLYTLFTLAVSGYGLFWLAEKNPDLKTKAEEILDFRTTQALEVRYTAAQIMGSEEVNLLKSKGARFLEPELKFYPYLLLEVKYSERGKTKEGHILWDLTDGEMVLDTKTWEKTHGFADCILSGAKENEYLVLHLIAEKGTLDIPSIQSRLSLEPPVTLALLRSCEKKNLIIGNGADRYRLHLENPLLPPLPQTKLYEQLTTRAHKRATRASKHFSSSQVERSIRYAFGPEFSIRTSTEIYLPIHRLVIQNPDGAVRTYHFNALTGQELPPARFYQ